MGNKWISMLEKQLSNKDEESIQNINSRLSAARSRDYDMGEKASDIEEKSKLNKAIVEKNKSSGNTAPYSLEALKNLKKDIDRGNVEIAFGKYQPVRAKKD